MKKKLTIIIAVVVVVAAASYLALRKSDTQVNLTQDSSTGLSIYTNLYYGFSVAYLNSVWAGPVEKFDAKADLEDPSINAVFASTSTSEVVVLVGNPGDTESFNEFAASLDSYNVVTVGGLPALRYEYVSPINEEGTLYAKTVTLVFKALPKGSITMAYQKIAQTEAEAKAADISKLDDFISRIAFTQASE